jgi:murein L,D-transpeptidase YcbB/YkuD
MTSLFHLEPVREKEEFTKPGTANVSVDDRKKLAGLLKHYRAQAHPFTACKRDQLRHGLSEDHANRRCAVLKDLLEGTTKWRKGSKSKSVEEAMGVICEALDVVQLAATGLGPRTMSALLREEVQEGVTDEWAEELRIAAALVEAAPRWMLPVAARRQGFRPLKPEKRKGTGGGSFAETKHRRAPKGTALGGQFIRMGSSGTEVAAIQRRLSVSETGTVNKQTKRAIEAFQKRKGIQVDGVIGTQTVSALRGTNSGVAPGALTRNDRRYLRRYTRRTSPSGSSRRSSSARRSVTR